MKTPNHDEPRSDAESSKKERTTIEVRLVSPPTQRALRVWEIAVPDALVAALSVTAI